MLSKFSEIETKKIKSIKIIFFDFDGVFTNNYVYVSEDGIESVRSSRSDGIGLSRIQKLGISTYIISSEKNKVVTKRAKKLNVNCCHGVKDKSVEVLRICNELSINPQKAVFVGNDINDIPAFNVLGFSVAVADSYKEIYPYVDYITESRGGEGAVREICDVIYNSYNC